MLCGKNDKANQALHSFQEINQELHDFVVEALTVLGPATLLRHWMSAVSDFFDQQQERSYLWRRFDPTDLTSALSAHQL